MDFFKVIEKRKSVRSYKNLPLPKDSLVKILDAAHLAPTARNIQPWQFVVITNKDILRKISEIAPNGKFLSQAAACIIVLCEETKYYLEDGCAATVNILNAACALGIGSCWIAGDKKDYCQAVLEMIDAPLNHKLVSLISLGFADNVLASGEKKKLESIIHWEKF